jgi:hypothetical protein
MLARMSGEAEAAGDAITGALAARAIEGRSAPLGAAAGMGACRNCGAQLAGAYCANCGQPAHIHRSLLSLGHDILHSVFHFEGKFWRTMPELFFHPGRLTRRYIDGERAKFVSPMALFLFTVFVMFAVFSFTAGTAFDQAAQTAGEVRDNWQSGNAAAIQQTNEKIQALEDKKADDATPPEERAGIDEQIKELVAARTVMEALAAGDLNRIAELDEDLAAAAEAAGSVKKKADSQVKIGWPALDQRLTESLNQANNNPGLLIYKLKINSYKFSWALIPLSLPFLWLMFFWRRDIHLYDHAIFATYSISFMMLLVIVLSIAAMLGAGAALWGTALGVIPPLHMYKQLRGAYGLSRFGASVRLMLLLLSTIFVLTIFGVLLLMVGVFA